MKNEKQSPSVTPEKKLVHFQMIGGVEQDILNLVDALGKMKKEGKLPEGVEFIVTNDKVELRDMKDLMKDLLRLYKKYKELKDDKK